MPSLASLANPTRFLALVDRVLPWLAALTVLVLLSASISPGSWRRPTTSRARRCKIMFIHVPAAWLAMFGYTLMAMASLGTLIWRHPLADVAAKTAAPIGATFTFLALVTGSLWGKPMWGTYWVWDARLTSVLVLFLLYLGLHRPLAGDRGAGPRRRAPPPSSPWSASSTCRSSNSRSTWWNTLHQPAERVPHGRLDHRPVPALARCSSWPSPSPCSSCCCIFSPCAPRSFAAACTRCSRSRSPAPLRPEARGVDARSRPACGFHSRPPMA